MYYMQIKTFQDLSLPNLEKKETHDQGGWRAHPAKKHFKKEEGSISEDKMNP